MKFYTSFLTSNARLAHSFCNRKTKATRKLLCEEIDTCTTQAKVLQLKILPMGKSYTKSHVGKLYELCLVIPTMCPMSVSAVLICQQPTSKNPLYKCVFTRSYHSVFWCVNMPYKFQKLQDTNFKSQLRILIGLRDRSMIKEKIREASIFHLMWNNAPCSGRFHFVPLLLVKWKRRVPYWYRICHQISATAAKKSWQISPSRSRRRPLKVDAAQKFTSQNIMKCSLASSSSLTREAMM